MLLFSPSFVRGEIFNVDAKRLAAGYRRERGGRGGREERGNLGVVFGIKRYLLGIIDLVPGDCYGKWI
ncbi:hypothetical protein [Tolypothrix sp. VBCCA 56010]|uniref:hypothetical protein n=1 Tax=Tolypothrix sp. VBCCA 56010 TaxID=3137731 RepID=UPI003D7DBBCD